MRGPIPVQPSRPGGEGEHPLPSEAFPLETHFAVLRRFMSVSRNGVDPVDPQAVEGGEIPAGAAQGNARFLADLGLLVEEAPGKFKPTGLAMQYVNTAALDDSRGRKMLRSLVAKMWFGRAATALLQARSEIPAKELAAMLAGESHASTASAGASAGILIEYLGYVGMVVLTERGISLAGSAPRPAMSGGSNSAAPRPAPGPMAPPPQPRSAAPADSAVPARPTAKGRRSPMRRIQTEDFDLKIRPDSTAVGRLRKQLDLLDEELRNPPT